MIAVAGDANESDPLLFTNRVSGPLNDAGTA